jgi:hypothetical protein
MFVDTLYKELFKKYHADGLNKVQIVTTLFNMFVSLNTKLSTNQQYAKSLNKYLNKLVSFVINKDENGFKSHWNKFKTQFPKTYASLKTKKKKEWWGYFTELFKRIQGEVKPQKLVFYPLNIEEIQKLSEAYISEYPKIHDIIKAVSIFVFSKNEPEQSIQELINISLANKSLKIEDTKSASVLLTEAFTLNKSEESMLRLKEFVNVLYLNKTVDIFLQGITLSTIQTDNTQTQPENLDIKDKDMKNNSEPNIPSNKNWLWFAGAGMIIISIIVIILIRRKK